MNRYNELKAIIAEFQNQTNSNSVLDFCTWIENKEELSKKIMEAHKKNMEMNAR